MSVQEAVYNHNKKIIDVSSAILVDKDGNVLLGRRSMAKPLGGKWEMPGGKIESGETPKQAIIRELQEEISLHGDVPNPVFLGIRKKETDYHIFILNIFLFSPFTIEMSGEHPDHSEVKFFRPEELDKLDLLDGNLKILKSALKALKSEKHN